MSTYNIYIIILIAALVLSILVIRHLYIRNNRLADKVKMNKLFTQISHELLTPMTILSASVDHLREKEPKNELEYELMSLNIQRTIRLLGQLNEKSKSTDDRLRLQVSNGDVMSYIRETARSVIPLVKRKGLEFEITCYPESMMGWIDTDKIDKIVFNLLSNSVKYTTKEGGKISIEVRTNTHYDRIEIIVKDNGDGIPAKRQKHIFEMYNDIDYKKYGSTNTDIGLSLTHDLVQLIGGSIRYESEENVGTTFYVTLPIGKESFSSSEIDESHSITIPMTNIIDFKAKDMLINSNNILDDMILDKNSSNLLFVDDNAELLLLMKQILRTKYNIFTASNGEKALEVVKKCDIDIIISDVNMPVMNGWQLTRTLKSNPEHSHLPIILLTSHDQEEEDKKKSLIAGADDCISKPFKMGDLQLRIRNLIENRQRIRGTESPTMPDTEAEEKDIIEKASSENDFIKRAVAMVQTHLDDSDYNREAFASDMGLSASSLYNKIREVTGMNVSFFIREIRMKEACRIAKSEPDIRISELAYRVGFKDPKYFATTFKKTIGMQPSEYIESVK